MNEDAIPEDALKAAAEALYDPDVPGPKLVTGPVLLRVAAAIRAERQRCIRAVISTSNDGGDTATCLSIAEEIRCPDIETKRRNPSP